MSIAQQLSLAQKPFLGFLILFCFLVMVFGVAISIGAIEMPFGDVIGYLLGNTTQDFTATVFYEIRLPRVLASLLSGFLLGMGGAMVQGIFRNPLADPGLIGVLAGAALAVIGFLSLMALIPAFKQVAQDFGVYALSVFAFGGGLITTFLVYRLSRFGTKTLVFTMLLAGVAINAFAGALSGFLIYISDDATLRSFTFWSLGSISGASWDQVQVLMAILVTLVLTCVRIAKPLNAMLLGESEAHCLGIKVEQTKKVVIVLVALSTCAVTAFFGMIGFIGLIVPHLIRLSIGADHRYLLILSGLLGGILLTLADLLCRTVVAPAEIPLGVITALVGAPFFLFLLLSQKQKGNPL